MMKYDSEKREICKMVKARKKRRISAFFSLDGIAPVAFSRHFHKLPSWDFKQKPRNCTFYFCKIELSIFHPSGVYFGPSIPLIIATK